MESAPVLCLTLFLADMCFLWAAPRPEMLQNRHSFYQISKKYLYYLFIHPAGLLFYTLTRPMEKTLRLGKMYKFCENSLFPL